MLDERLSGEYGEAFRLLLKGLKSMDREVISVALLGSVTRDDFTPGWSDLDVLVVVRSRKAARKVKELSEAINKKFHPVAKGAPILSLWIDTYPDVLNWFGRGCEYYNTVKNYIHVQGEDLRTKLKEPSWEEVRASIAAFLKELKNVMSKVEKTEASQIGALGIASILFPTIRFYLCAKGVPTASKTEMIRVVKSRGLLDSEGVAVLEKLYACVKEGRQETEPWVLRKALEIIKSVQEELERAIK